MNPIQKRTLDWLWEIYVWRYVSWFYIRMPLSRWFWIAYIRYKHWGARFVFLPVEMDYEEAEIFVVIYSLFLWCKSCVSDNRRRECVEKWNHVKKQFLAIWLLFIRCKTTTLKLSSLHLYVSSTHIEMSGRVLKHPGCWYNIRDGRKLVVWRAISLCLCIMHFPFINIRYISLFPLFHSATVSHLPYSLSLKLYFQFVSSSSHFPSIFLYLPLSLLHACIDTHRDTKIQIHTHI